MEENDQPNNNEATETKNPPDNAKKQPRVYSVKDITLVFLICFVLSLAFSSPVIYTWAKRLDFGLTRSVILFITQPLYTLCDTFKLNEPYRAVKNIFRSIANIKTDAGWLVSSDLNQSNTTKPVTDSIPVPSASPPPKSIVKYSASRPLRVLLLGDSMVAEGLSTMFGRGVANDNTIYYEKKAHYSSGLSRPDFYNWPAQVDSIFTEKQFDLVIVMLGMNDGQDFSENNRVYKYGTDEWFSIYRSRTISFMQQITKNVTMLYWLGCPLMRLPVYNQKMQTLDAIYQEASSLTPGSLYVPTRYVLSNDDQKYTDYILSNNQLVKIRTDDGIHFTYAGAGLIVSAVLNQIHMDFNFEEPGASVAKESITDIRRLLFPSPPPNFRY